MLTLVHVEDAGDDWMSHACDLIIGCIPPSSLTLRGLLGYGIAYEVAVLGSTLSEVYRVCVFSAGDERDLLSVGWDSGYNARNISSWILLHVLRPELHSSVASMGDVGVLDGVVFVVHRVP